MRHWLGRVLVIGCLFAAACEAPEDAGRTAEPGVSSPPDRLRAGREPAYAGEWASKPDLCNDESEIWTIEARRLGMKRELFCVFDPMPHSGAAQGQGWAASASCHADGRPSRDFLFFRVEPGQLQMRVTINDERSVELFRCATRA